MQCEGEKGGEVWRGTESRKEEAKGGFVFLDVEEVAGTGCSQV